MNIVFAFENALNYYTIGMHNAARELGHNSILWNKNQISAFDMSSELKPDILFNNTEVITKDLKKARDKFDYKLVILYTEHKGEEDNIIYWPKQYGFDTYNYTKGKLDNNLKCDICIVSNYENSKRQIWRNTLKPIIDGGYSVKIFGHTAWPTPNYLGYISNERLSDLYFSARYSLCDNKKEQYWTILGSGGRPQFVDRSAKDIIDLLQKPNVSTDELQETLAQNHYTSILKTCLDSINAKN